MTSIGDISHGFQLPWNLQLCNGQTIGAARAWASEELRQASVESPALSAELLIGHVLNIDRVHVLTHPEAVMDKEDWARLQALVHRCAAGEPIQYLMGEQEFYGLVFRVTPAVMIPRPETELLVEKTLNLATAGSLESFRFLDVGTGSGCITVSLVHQSPSSLGWAIDLSATALEIARENAVRHEVFDRVCFVQGDLLQCTAPKPYFHFIVSNPPYVAAGEYENLHETVRNYEPRRALFGGESGLGIYRRLVPGVRSRLLPGGYFLTECGAGQSESVARLIRLEGLTLQETLQDLQGIPRCLVAQKRPGRRYG